MVKFPAAWLVCYTGKDITRGAQTWRRGDGGPVRTLLGSVASPAFFFGPTSKTDPVSMTHY